MHSVWPDSGWYCAIGQLVHFGVVRGPKLFVGGGVENWSAAIFVD